MFGLPHFRMLDLINKKSISGGDKLDYEVLESVEGLGGWIYDISRRLFSTFLFRIFQS